MAGEVLAVLPKISNYVANTRRRSLEVILQRLLFETNIGRQYCLQLWENG